MSENVELSEGHSRRGGEPASLDREELVAQVELLRARNRRLYEEYVRQQRETYRNTALGLVGVALLAFGGAVVLPLLRELLVALGATGVFAAVLTYYVTPDHVLTGATGDRVYGAFADNAASLVRQLGLSDSRVYVPTGSPETARLFVPQYDDFELPASTALESPLVVTERERERGLSLSPTGAALFREFERTLAEPLGSVPGDAVPQLCDGLTETLELAETVEGASETGDREASFRVSDPVWGDVDRIDHPVPSFLAVGCAVALDVPVAVDVVPVDDENEVLVSVTWDT